MTEFVVPLMEVCVKRELNLVDPTPTGSLSSALTHAQHLLRSKPALAEAQAQEILLVHPHQPEAQLILAHALAARGAIEEAREVLTSLTALQPKHPHAWRDLGDLCRARGEQEAAAACYARHVEAASQDPRLLEAGRMLAEDKLAVAERLLRAFLKLYPTDIAAIRMLAETGSRLGRYEEAEKLLARALEIAPRFRMARQNYATVLYRQNKAIEAIAQADILLTDEPDSAGLQALKAAALGQIGEYVKAAAIYDVVLTNHPHEPMAWMSCGHTLRALGRRDESIGAYRKAVVLRPGLGEAWFSLANMKTYRFTSEEVAQMESQLARPDLSAEDRWHLHFALGKAFEDSRSYLQSFEHYEEGNRLRRATVDYNTSEMPSHVARSIVFFTTHFFDERAGWGKSAPDPIFIVGLPRSGSTLIEQILASHSAIEGTMELPDMVSIARRIGGKMKRSDTSLYPELLAEFGEEEFASLGEEYLSRAQIHRRLGRRHFIDKMPNNFAHAGLIHLMLPNAKIIDARRHPLACCFSVYKQHFARGQAFSYDLEDIGRYYHSYASLMAHFDTVLPGRIHRVYYEQMVTDPEYEIRRLLDHLELPYEDACLHHYANERPVRSASSEQVRQPIFTEGLEQWRNYEEWLGALKSILAREVASYPAVALPSGQSSQGH